MQLPNVEVTAIAVTAGEPSVWCNVFGELEMPSPAAAPMTASTVARMTSQRQRTTK